MILTPHKAQARGTWHCLSEIPATTGKWLGERSCLEGASFVLYTRGEDAKNDGADQNQKGHTDTDTLTLTH